MIITIWCWLKNIEEKSLMTPFQIIRKKSLYPWVRNTTSRWSNGTKILTTFIFCSKPNLILNYQSSSMHIKVPVQDLSTKNLLLCDRNYRKKYIGQGVFVC